MTTRPSALDLFDMRFAAAMIIADGLTEAGRTLQRTTTENDDATRRGLATIAVMAGQTGAAAARLYAEQLWYAGAALTRQLVEHHHLFVYFAQAPSNVVAWLDADEALLRRRFSPAKLREAGGFTRVDYQAHCIWGGHPNPAGMWLVTEDSPDLRNRLLILDLVQHLTFIYVALVGCLGQDAANALPGMVKAYNFILKWRKADPLANGLPVGADAQLGAMPETDQ